MIASVQIGVNSPLGSAPYQDPNLSQPSTGGGALPVDTNDTLRLDVYTLVDWGPVRLNAIVRTWHGDHYEYTPYQRDFQFVNVIGALNRYETPLTRGELISVMVQSLAGTSVEYGDIFIRLAVIRGQTSDFLRYPTAVLIQDYLTSMGYVAWPGPGARIITTPQNRGSLIVYPSIPAAGAEVAFAIPANTLLVVHNIRGVFAAAAAAANRSFGIYLQDATPTRIRSYESEKTRGIAVANSANRFYLQAGSNSITDSNVTILRSQGSLMTIQSNVANLNIFQADFQPLAMRVGWQIITLTTNIQAADAWSDFEINAERWVFPNVNTP